jgi:hypothetical protein
MDFHLNYTPPKLPSSIDHTQGLLMMGSCFTESIGDYLTNFKFKCFVNPNGILFNPASIGFAMESYISNTMTDGYTIQSKGLFYNLNYHGDYCYATEQELNAAMTSSRQAAHFHLKNSEWMIITFGSAYVYRHLATNHIAANCHKLLKGEFKKELLKPGEIVDRYKALITSLKQFVPKLKLLFTVSPVKHLRDGIIENTLSKSILIQSVHELVNTNTHCFYFPAYELMNDDLRDYRFYKEDLAHPNKVAIKYIWEKFSGSIFSEETQQLNEQIEYILNAASHKAINPGSESHKQFKQTYLKKCEDLERKFQFLDFEKEKRVFKS